MFMRCCGSIVLSWEVIHLRFTSISSLNSHDFKRRHEKELPGMEVDSTTPDLFIMSHFERSETFTVKMDFRRWNFYIAGRSQKMAIVQEQSFKIQNFDFSERSWINEHSYERSWFKANIFCDRPGTTRNDRRTFILSGSWYLGL